MLMVLEKTNNLFRGKSQRKDESLRVKRRLLICQLLRLEVLGIPLWLETVNRSRKLSIESEIDLL